MAKVSNPLIGKTTQSLGGVTFTTWKGIDVIKTKVTKPKNPKTPKQVAQRARLTTLVKVYQESPSIYQKGFKSLAVRQSEYNAFLKKNIKDFFKADQSIDNLKFFVSDGSMEATNVAAATFTTSTKIVKIDWNKNELSGGRADNDTVLASVIEWDITLKKIVQVKTVTDGTLRSAGTVNLTVDNALTSTNKFTVYLGFTDSKNIKQSTSVAKAIP